MIESNKKGSHVTFKDFKQKLKIAMFGDKRVKGDGSDDDILLPIINQSIESVSKLSKPAYLISNNIKDQVLDTLCCGYFIRRHKQIINDDSILDIDEELHEAVVYNAAFVIGSIDNKVYYQSVMDQCISDYLWMIHETVKDIEGQEEKIKAILETHGKKHISTVYQSVAGEIHDFDSDFIKTLDLYLLGVKNIAMTKSQYENINIFINYANESLESDDDKFEEFQELDKYLATIGV